MAKNNAEIIYNQEEDILNLSRGKSSRASIEIGDFVLDIDSNGFVSAIEILNASENLGLSRETLKKLKTSSRKSNNKRYLLEDKNIFKKDF